MKPKQKDIFIKSKKLNSEPIRFKEVCLVILALAAIVFLVYSSSFHNEFTNWDDNFYITKNQNIQQFRVKQIFTELVTDVYAPLTLLTFAVEYHFVKLKPFLYLFNNFLLHIAVSSLIFFFGRKIGLNLRAALAGAIIFAIHPMHVESVAWITERKDVLYAFFYMLAVVFYWRYLENKKVSTYLWTVLWGILSMLSKPMALSLPFVLFVCDWFYGRKFTKQVLLEKWVHFIYIVPIAYVTFQAHAKVPSNNFIESILFGLWTFTFYFKKFFLPLTLVPIYNVPHPISFERLDFNIAVLIFWLFLYLVIRYRNHRWFMFAVLYYIASSFFLFRIKEEVHPSTVADRFMYLPSLGICLWLGYVWDEKLRFFKNKSNWKFVTIWVVSVMIFMALGVKAYTQCRIWKNSAALWDAIIEKSPNSTAFNNRGQIYLDNGEYDKAIELFDKAIKAHAKQHTANYNKGLIFMRRNQYDLAMESFDKAIAINPQYQPAYHNKAYIYWKTNKSDLALKTINQAVECNPMDKGVYYLRANIYTQLGRYKEALDDALKAQSLGFSLDPKELDQFKKKVQK